MRSMATTRKTPTPMPTATISVHGSTSPLTSSARICRSGSAIVMMSPSRKLTSAMSHIFFDAVRRAPILLPMGSIAISAPMLNSPIPTTSANTPMTNSTTVLTDSGVNATLTSSTMSAIGSTDFRLSIIFSFIAVIIVFILYHRMRRFVNPVRAAHHAIKIKLRELFAFSALFAPVRELRTHQAATSAERRGLAYHIDAGAGGRDAEQQSEHAVDERCVFGAQPCQQHRFRGHGGGERRGEIYEFQPFHQQIAVAARTQYTRHRQRYFDKRYDAQCDGRQRSVTPQFAREKHVLQCERYIEKRRDQQEYAYLAVIFQFFVRFATACGSSAEINTLSHPYAYDVRAAHAQKEEGGQYAEKDLGSAAYDIVNHRHSGSYPHAAHRFHIHESADKPRHIRLLCADRR